MCMYFCDIIYRACFVHVWHAHTHTHALQHRCVKSFIRACVCLRSMHEPLSHRNGPKNWCQFRSQLRITVRWVLLGMICVVRYVQQLSEQPRGSLMPRCPYIKFLELIVKPAFWGAVSLSGAQVISETWPLSVWCRWLIGLCSWAWWNQYDSLIIGPMMTHQCQFIRWARLQFLYISISIILQTACSMHACTCMHVNLGRCSQIRSYISNLIDWFCIPHLANPPNTLVMLSNMGAYKHRNVKPTVIFGTSPEPHHACCMYSILLVLDGIIESPHWPSVCGAKAMGDVAAQIDDREGQETDREKQTGQTCHGYQTDLQVWKTYCVAGINWGCHAQSWSKISGRIQYMDLKTCFLKIRWDDVTGLASISHQWFSWAEARRPWDAAECSLHAAICCCHHEAPHWLHERISATHIYFHQQPVSIVPYHFNFLGII